MHNGTPPEWSLLLSLLKGHPEAPPSGMDAARFVSLVDFHRIALRLEALACANLPEELQIALADRRHSAGMKTVARATELRRLARAFEAKGLPWLTFKGHAFSLLLHGRPGRRACRDIDLLVPVGTEAAATALLAEAGYTGLPRVPGIRQTELRHVHTGWAVELHVGVIDEDALFPERLFQPFRRIVRANVGGIGVPTLGLEPALVFAAFHGCKHFWRRLFWVQDFADAARSDRVDWEAVLGLARTLGCERHLALAAALAERWLDAPVPAPLAARPRLRRAGRDASMVLDRLSDLPLPILDVDAYRRLGPWKVLRWKLDLHRRAPARLALLWEMARPGPDDRAMIALPARLSPLYYIIRPLRLLWRELRRLAAAVNPPRPPAPPGTAPDAKTALPQVPTIDFVVPCGRPESAAATLRSLLACDGEGRIIVVGAGLTDLRATFPGERLVWVETGRLLWPGVNRNRGAAHSQADVIAFVDDDCTVAPDFARKVRDRFASDPGLGALTGGIQTRPQGYWAWVYDLLNYPIGLRERPVAGVGNFSCVFCMRRAAFLRVGGCDCDLRFNEDTALARRTRSEGTATLCDPAIAIGHRHPRTSARPVLAHMFRIGSQGLVYERKQAAEGRAKARIKLVLRPLQPIVAPAFIALKMVQLAREVPLRLWLPYLPGVLAGAAAFEAGRTVGWWRR